MYDLGQNHYARIQPLMQSGIQHPEMLAVIARHNPGIVFVDDLAAPRVALIWSFGIKGFYLVGDAEKPGLDRCIKACVDGVIAPKAKLQGLTHFEVSGATDEWATRIRGIFREKKLDSWQQQINRWEPNGRSSVYLESTGCEIISVNRDTDGLNLGNIDLLHNKISSFWGDIENLIANRGKCCCAVIERKIVGICLSGFVIDNIHAVDIEVVPEYRHRGIAYQLSCRFIEELLISGQIPYWDCMLDNQASMRLAQKLGFVRAEKYLCFGFELA